MFSAYGSGGYQIVIEGLKAGMHVLLPWHRLTRRAIIIAELVAHAQQNDLIDCLDPIQASQLKSLQSVATSKLKAYSRPLSRDVIKL